MKKKVKKKVSTVVYSKEGLISILGVDKYNELNSSNECGVEESFLSGDMLITIFREARFTETALNAVCHATK
ncbi:MAG: hypothetical protein HXN12_09540 [Porphyromonadaceae bacterium]|nr:hypothetical protein [Porphyromonadaceae bacterium]